VVAEKTVFHACWGPLRPAFHWRTWIRYWRRVFATAAGLPLGASGPAFPLTDDAFYSGARARLSRRAQPLPGMV